MTTFPNHGDEVVIGLSHPSQKARGMRGVVTYVNEKLDQVQVLVPGIWEFRCRLNDLEEVKR